MHSESVDDPLVAVPSPAPGVCILVDGHVVAWFAKLDESAEDWCRENHFGQWLAWAGTAPTPIPLSAAVQAEIERAAEQLCMRFQEPRLAPD